MRERDNHWIITYTGRQFWPLDPRPEDVYIEDIAHALSNLCRFTGHCLKFYSVAQHSVYVSKHCGEFALQGLLHDAAEAYLGDMSRPLKRSFLGDKFKECEMRLQKCILDSLGVQEDGSVDVVREADTRMLATEKQQIVIPHDHKWTDIQGNNIDPYSFTIPFIDQFTAEKLFLARFNYLTRGV